MVLSSLTYLLYIIFLQWEVRIVEGQFWAMLFYDSTLLVSWNEQLVNFQKLIFKSLVFWSLWPKVTLYSNSQTALCGNSPDSSFRKMRVIAPKVTPVRPGVNAMKVCKWLWSLRKYQIFFGKVLKIKWNHDTERILILPLEF